MEMGVAPVEVSLLGQCGDRRGQQRRNGKGHEFRIHGFSVRLTGASADMGLASSIHFSIFALHYVKKIYPIYRDYPSTLRNSYLGKPAVSSGLGPRPEGTRDECAWGEDDLDELILQRTLRTN